MTTDLSLTLEDRAILAAARRRRLDLRAQRALLAATEGLTLCILAALGRLRAAATPGAGDRTELLQTRLQLAEAREQAAILADRLARLGPRHRPHYTPELRFRILEHMRTFHLSIDDAARRFLVTPQTLGNWLALLRQRPRAQAIGVAIRPSPPVTRKADVVRALVRRMHSVGFGGAGKIAETLARCGWRVSRTSAWRYIHERSRDSHDPAPVPPRAGTPSARDIRTTSG